MCNPATTRLLSLLRALPARPPAREARPPAHLGVAQRGGAPRLRRLLEPALLPQPHALVRHLEDL